MPPIDQVQHRQAAAHLAHQRPDVSLLSDSDARTRAIALCVCVYVCVTERFAAGTDAVIHAQVALRCQVHAPPPVHCQA